MPVIFVALLAISAPTDSRSSAPITVGDWNQYVIRALKVHAQGRSVDAVAAARKLAEVVQEVQAAEKLSASNQRRLVRQIQRRLEVVGQGHLAQRRAPADGGEGVRQHKGAEELKSLIEQTIDAESWDVNGGKGHIHVFKE